MKTLLCLLAFALLAIPATSKEAVAKPTFSATVNGHQIEVLIRYGKLDPKTRKVSARDTKTESGEKNEQWLLQGKPVLGLDNTDPAKGFGKGKPFDVIDSITIIWDGKKQEVAPKLFDHIVFPHRKTNLKNGEAGLFFVVDPSGDAIIVDLGIGDGAGSTGIAWLFTSKGTQKIQNRGIFDRNP